jgi:polyisoprenyl-phosphate glycosyltransferase
VLLGAAQPQSKCEKLHFHLPSACASGSVCQNLLRAKNMSVGYHRKKITVVTPVFNDWEAFAQLLEQIGSQTELANYDVYVFAVDDGSSEAPDEVGLNARKGLVSDLWIIRLACNLGHQRAIAIGLVAASKVHDTDAVVVMDSDGEDRPGDVARLIAAWDEQPERIIFAQRGQRSEGFMFTICYSIYKVIFRMLSGQSISFGNFCLLPGRAVQALIHNPAIWNNLAAAITRSRIPYAAISVNRGRRLAGTPRMNFMNLAVHGLSAMSVYTDVILVRIIAAACMLAVVILVALAGVVAIKFATDWAIPGWASYVAASLTVIFIQAALLAGIALIQLLSFRSMKLFVPALDAKVFIFDSEQNIGRQW